MNEVAHTLPAEEWLNIARRYRYQEKHSEAVRTAYAAHPEPSHPLYHRLKAEVATSGYYCKNPALYELGHTACEELALSRDCHPAARHIAFQNLFFYTKKLSEYAPSFHAWRLELDDLLDGYWPTNPSICRLRDKMFMNVRCVNYYTYEDEKVILPTEEPLRTRNVLTEIRKDFRCEVISEVLPPGDLPRLNTKQPLGVEDIRLFPWRNDLWSSGTVVQHKANEMAEILVARIPATMTQCQWNIWQNKREPRHQKNWSPIIEDTGLPRFIYSHDPFRIFQVDLNPHADDKQPPIAAHTFSGSTQAIPWEGGWLVMIHEKTYQPEMKFTRRWYQQRFVWYDKDWNLREISRRFQFDSGETEFPCGMCIHPDGRRLVISYGVLDREAWLATVACDEVNDMLYGVK